MITNKNSTIITWKWEDDIFFRDMEKEISELCQRFSPSMLFISLHWIKRKFCDDKLQAMIKKCKEETERHGVKLCVEACLRNEGEDFYNDYPQECRAYLAGYETVTLDENGFGEFITDAEPVYHYWRISGENGIEKIYSAYCFSEGEGYLSYKPESLCVIEDVAIESFTLEGGEKKVRVSINSTVENAGKTAFVTLLTKQPLPDLASDKFPEYYQKMLNLLKDIEPAGVYSDEWGYDVILKITEQNPYDDNNLFIRHLTVSDNLAAAYENETGRKLCKDTLHFIYTPENQPEVRINAINGYLKTLRKIMTKNDNDMYKIAKETIGSDAFYGVHPTWWGSVDSLNFEFFKNGFYWWEAKRDIAQTDETVTPPIRTALSHKWKSPIFYNMWYSLGTKKIETYYRNTWDSVRIGGRTHYMSYRCPNEPVVLELAGEGLLESLEEMEKKVRLVDNCQETALDCRTLVLFGMEAVSNWAFEYGSESGVIKDLLPPWAPQNKKLDAVLNTSDKLFCDTLCDLVPTSEIENGSITLNDKNMPVYGTQEYDAIILFYPDIMPAKCHEFLKKADKSKLIVCGAAQSYSDGSPLNEEDDKYLEKAAFYFNEIPDVNELVSALSKIGVQKNRTKNGCAMQDGSWIFTAEGNQAIGNPLSVNEIINGHKINFEGTDFLFVNFKDEEIKAVYGGGEFSSKHVNDAEV